MQNFKNYVFLSKKKNNDKRPAAFLFMLIIINIYLLTKLQWPGDSEGMPTVVLAGRTKLRVSKNFFRGISFCIC